MFVIVVGGGKVGSHLASLLLADGYRVKVVEIRADQLPGKDEEALAGAFVLGDGTSPEVLEAVGVRHCDVVAAVTGADETNLVVTSLARSEFGVPRTIARVNNPKNAWLFTADMGVDVALNQADLMSHLIAEEMSLGDMMTLLRLRRGQFALVEEKVDPQSVALGQPIGELHLPGECLIAAIIRQGRVVFPDPEAALQASDEVLAVVHTSQLQALAALLGRPPVRD